jgi:hypothetical protein
MLDLMLWLSVCAVLGVVNGIARLILLARSMDRSIRKAKLSIQSHVNFTIQKKLFYQKPAFIPAHEYMDGDKCCRYN